MTKRVLLGGATIASAMVIGLLAACSGNSGGGTPAAAASVGGRAAFQAYTDCLRQHGVTASNGPDLNSADPKVVAAMTTCAPLRPTPRPSGS